MLMWQLFGVCGFIVTERKKNQFLWSVSYITDLKNRFLSVADEQITLILRDRQLNTLSIDKTFLFSRSYQDTIIWLVCNCY